MGIQLDEMTVNKMGFYEIRLESIGGLGANLCGKMLGELGIRCLSLNSASFSSYGSEKTGTPVKAYVRYSNPRREIRVHSPVKQPHLLGIFHEALLKDPTVLEGAGADTVIVLNTGEKSAETDMIFEKENADCKRRFPAEVSKFFCIPAQKIAMETKSRINVVMLGALARAMGFVQLRDVIKICEETIGKKYPKSLPGNLEGITRGFDEAKNILEGREEKENIKRKEENKIEVWDEEKRKRGYQTMPLGGINPHIGNSVISDLSASRQGYFPIFLQEKCINCGLCDSTCPDMVFQFQKGIFRGREIMINRGLDYYHCKGCLRCVEVCPTRALERGLEAEHPKKERFMPNQDLLRTPAPYEEAGPDGYITSEAYLAEKRIEGGEV